MNLKNDESKSVKKQLLKEMKEGIYADYERLPRETVLAESLGISRTQLRDVLAALETEGFVTRRQGIGTVINRHVLQAKNRMDIETEFLDIIRQNGHEPSVAFLQVSEGAADEEAAERLRIETGMPIICIRLLCSANGEPAIYSEDILDRGLLKREYEKTGFQGSVFEFLEQFCDLEPYMDLSEIHPVLTDEKLSELLQLPAGTPLLHIREVDYDIDGDPIFYSRQYFVDTYFQHTILRKKL